MKTKTLLMTAVMLVCFSAVASAQAVYWVSSTPITTVISTGNAELAGNITFTQVTSAFSNVTTTGTISISYGGYSISSPFSGVGAITITGTGGYCGNTPTINLPTSGSTYIPGVLVLNIPAGVGLTGTTACGGTIAGSSPPVATSTFTVNGVRLQIYPGLTAPVVATITASPASGGNLIESGQDKPTVISGSKDGLASVVSYIDAVPVKIASGTTTGLPSIAPLTGAITSSNTTIVVKENFLSAYTLGVGVRVTVNATPPKGVTFSFPATANSYDSTGTNPALHNWICGASTTTTGSGTAQTISSTSTGTGLQVYYYVATDTGLGGDFTQEYLEIPVTVGSSASLETFPLSAAQFTYTVTLAPILGAYSTLTPNPIPYGAPAPRFVQLEIGPANLASIGVGRYTTALLVPYASTLLGFDTALSISNTTYDPGATLLGVTNSAIAQTGTVTFYFFPAKTATYTYSTYTTAAGSPGSGLDASGNVISGGTYVVFVSQLVPLATPALTNFSGYMIAVTNFSNAHGIFVVSNFTNLSVQSGMMPVFSDRSVLPERLLF